MNARQALDDSAADLVGRLVTPARARPFATLHAMNRLDGPEDTEHWDWGVTGLWVAAMSICVVTWTAVIWLVWQAGLWVERELTR